MVLAGAHPMFALCALWLVLQLTHSLAAALQGGNTRSTLAHLLVAGHMLAISAWSPAEYAAVLQQAGAACQEGHTGVDRNWSELCAL
jgi:hypothetical protein